MSVFSDFWNDDRIEREFEESGLKCCTRTMPIGHRCGYVALPKDHPMFGKDWDACYDIAPDLDVDGGITFARGIGETWILGWDAAHCWHVPDVSLMDWGTREFHERFRKRYGDFREEGAYMVDADRAEAETRRFAKQLAGKAVKR